MLEATKTWSCVDGRTVVLRRHIWEAHGGGGCS